MTPNNYGSVVVYCANNHGIRTPLSQDGRVVTVPCTACASMPEPRPPGRFRIWREVRKARQTLAAMEREQRREGRPPP